MVVFHHSIENPPRHQGPSPPEARGKIRMFIYNMLNISCTCLSISYKYTYIYIYITLSLYISTQQIYISYIWHCLTGFEHTPRYFTPTYRLGLLFVASFPRVQEMNSQCLPSLVVGCHGNTPEALNREPKTHPTEKENHLNLWTSIFFSSKNEFSRV